MSALPYYTQETANALVDMRTGDVRWFWCAETTYDGGELVAVRRVIMDGCQNHWIETANQTSLRLSSYQGVHGAIVSPVASPAAKDVSLARQWLAQTQRMDALHGGK